MPVFGCVSLIKKIQEWILKSERIRKWIFRFFTEQINPRSLGSWYVKATEESTSRVNFGFKNPTWISLKKRTLGYAVPVFVVLCLSVLGCACLCLAVPVFVTQCLSLLGCICICYAMPARVGLCLSDLVRLCLSSLRCACPTVVGVCLSLLRCACPTLLGCACLCYAVLVQPWLGGACATLLGCACLCYAVPVRPLLGCACLCHAVPNKSRS